MRRDDSFSQSIQSNHHKIQVINQIRFIHSLKTHAPSRTGFTTAASADIHAILPPHRDVVVRPRVVVVECGTRAALQRDATNRRLAFFDTSL